MYWEDIWRFENSNEYEYKFAGNYGAKGEKRERKEKPTPEQIRKQNQRNRENKVRRLIKANFKENDCWNTLKYPAGTRMGIGQVKKHMDRFLRKARAEYRKQGYEFQYIYRIEIGKRGSPHVHILMNRIQDWDLIVKKCWEQGSYNYTPAYEAGGFKRLAEYITKQPSEEQDPKGETKPYSCSRNLIRPQPERREYKRRTLERRIREGILPTEGYYIDEESVYYGVNRYTGMTYLKYIEYRLPEGGRRNAGNQPVYGHKCKIPAKADSEVSVHPGAADNRGAGDAGQDGADGGNKAPYRGRDPEDGPGKST